MKINFGTEAALENDPVTGNMVRALDGAPTVVTCVRQRDENGEYLNKYTIGTSVAEIKDHLLENSGMVSHLPDNTALLSIWHSFRAVSDKKPTWVAVDADGGDAAEAEDLERFWAEFHNIPRGRPDDVEATHWTRHGNRDFPPGETPPTADDLAKIDDDIRATAAAEAAQEASA